MQGTLEARRPGEAAEVVARAFQPMARDQQERVLDRVMADMFGEHERQERITDRLIADMLGERIDRTVRVPRIVCLRPGAVLVRPGKPDTDQDQRYLSAAGAVLGHDPDDIALLHVPEHASPTAKLVAHAIAAIATRRLQAGDRLDFALNVAAGRDLIVRELAANHGVQRDRSTVADALSELVHLGVLTRAGQLQPWVDASGVKTGAYVYTLRLRFRRLGDLATAARVRALPLLAAVGGEGRIERCLKAAIRLADVGQRNSLGHWLARRCSDERLTFTEAERIMTVYRGSVPGRPTYTVREALATLKSVYRRTGLAPPRMTAPMSDKALAAVGFVRF